MNTNKNPEISVLMPTYNGAKFLKETIDSILNQTFTDFEFIIINDCSPDTEETDKIIANYDDSRIRYIHNEENLGISGSSNKGIALAKGKYIARQDHDDISLRTRLEEQYNYMESHPEVGVCGTWAKTFGRGFLKNKTNKYPVKNSEIKANLFNRCPILHPSSVMRKEIFTKHNLFYDESYKTGNDLKLWLDASKLTKFHNIPKILFKYRMHSNRTSETQSDRANDEMKMLFNFKFNLLDLELTSEEKDIFYSKIVKNKNKNFDVTLLEKIEKILKKIVEANNKTNFFPNAEFNNIIGRYWLRRCFNLTLKSKGNIYKIYKNSDLFRYSKSIDLQKSISFKLISALLPNLKS